MQQVFGPLRSCAARARARAQARGRRGGRRSVPELLGSRRSPCAGRRGGGSPPPGRGDRAVSRPGYPARPPVRTHQSTLTRAVPKLRACARRHLGAAA